EGEGVGEDRERAGIEREGAQPAADEGQVGGPEVFLADLNGRQTRRQAVAHDHGEIAAARLAAVSDEAESQLVQSGTPSRGEDAVAESLLPIPPARNPRRPAAPPSRMARAIATGS